MSYRKPEQLDRHERPGVYKRHLKRKKAKAQRRIAKAREDGGRLKVPLLGYSS